MVYPALLPLVRTPRLPVVNWNDATGLFCLVALKVQCICHNVLSRNVCLQLRSQGFANGTTVTQLPGLGQHLGILWPTLCLFRGPKRRKSLEGARQGCAENVGRHSHPNCCNKTTVCREMWDLGTIRLPEEYLGGHICQIDTEVHVAVS